VVDCFVHMCSDIDSFWTWEVFLISFFGIILLVGLIAAIVYFACMKK